MILFCDTETFSPVPIRNGAHRYAEQARVLLWTYALDEGEVQCWDVASGQAMPYDLAEALADENCMLCWQNGDMFDRVVLSHAMPTLKLPAHRLIDTKVLALQHGLPGGLDKLCEVFHISADTAKLKSGRALIGLFCSPHADGSVQDASTHPEQWLQFVEYAKRDIAAMREVYKKIPKWNDTQWERECWALDIQMNNRGFAADVELAEAVVRAVDIEQASLKRRTQALTGYEAGGKQGVASATQRDALLEHLLSEYLVDLPDLKADTIERRLADESLPAELRELLAIRLQATTSSTAKYKALLRSVSADGRVRGTMQFRGASRTGRTAHRLFQPANLSRGTHSPEDVELAVQAFKLDAAPLITDNLMALASSCVRGCIVAAPGSKLVVSDWSAIEGRVLAWLAGEETELAAYRAYDAGTGPDLYKLAYATAFSVPVESVSKGQRTLGKIMTLMLGFGSGVGGFVTGCASYGIDPQEIAASSYDSLPDAAREEAENYYEYCLEAGRSTYHLPRRVFITCDAIKRLWREAHPRTVALWAALGRAAELAVANPGHVFPAGRHLSCERRGNWLLMRLPSGRYLCYPSPRSDDSGLSYNGVDQYTRKYQRIRTYAGKWAEQATQATAADILWCGLLAADQAGYTPVLSVHDEIVAEVPDTDEFTADGLAQIMCRPLPWAVGLPLAAAAEEMKRYRK